MHQVVIVRVRDPWAMSFCLSATDRVQPQGNPGIDHSAGSSPYSVVIWWYTVHPFIFSSSSVHVMVVLEDFWVLFEPLLYIEWQVQLLVCLTVALKKTALGKRGVWFLHWSHLSGIHTVALFAHHLATNLTWLFKISNFLCVSFTLLLEMLHTCSHMFLVHFKTRTMDQVIVQVWLADGFSVSVLTVFHTYLKLSRSRDEGRPKGLTPPQMLWGRRLR